MSPKATVQLLFVAAGAVALATFYGFLSRAPYTATQPAPAAVHPPPAQKAEGHSALRQESHHYRVRNRSFALTENTPAAIRCVATKGPWCYNFFKQQVHMDL